MSPFLTAFRATHILQEKPHLPPKSTKALRPSPRSPEPGCLNVVFSVGVLLDPPSLLSDVLTAVPSLWRALPAHFPLGRRPQSQLDITCFHVALFSHRL